MAYERLLKEDDSFSIPMAQETEDEFKILSQASDYEPLSTQNRSQNRSGTKDNRIKHQKSLDQILWLEGTDYRQVLLESAGDGSTTADQRTHYPINNTYSLRR